LQLRGERAIGARDLRGAANKVAGNGMTSMPLPRREAGRADGIDAAGRCRNSREAQARTL
jgi:hypothetical protein